MATLVLVTACGTDDPGPLRIEATLRYMFASDGPQYPGAIASYLGRLVEGMRTAGYSEDEIEAVLAKNFDQLFTRTKQRSSLSSGRAAASDR